MAWRRPNLTQTLVYTIIVLISLSILLIIISISTTHWIHNARVRAGLWMICHLTPLNCFHSISRSAVTFSFLGLGLIIFTLIFTLVFDLFDLYFSLRRYYFSLVTLALCALSGLALTISLMIFTHLTGHFGYSFYLMFGGQLLTMYAAIVVSYLQGRRHALSSASSIITRFNLRRT